MPKSVALNAMPEFTRVVTASKWANLAAFVRDHIDSKVGHTQAMAFDGSDGIDKDNFGAASQAIRNTAKAMGFKVRVMYVAKENTLYAKTDGAFVERGPRTPKATSAKKAPAKK